MFGISIQSLECQLFAQQYQEDHYGAFYIMLRHFFLHLIAQRNCVLPYHLPFLPNLISTDASSKYVQKI